MLLAAVTKPSIDWAGVSPLIALLGGSIVVLLAGLLRGRFVREQIVPFLTIVAFGAAIGLGVWQWDDAKDLFVAKGAQGALRSDDLTLMILFIVAVTGIGATLLAVPDWGPSGWDQRDYAFSGPEPSQELTLHHCRDDDVVPVEHLALMSAKLPYARTVEHERGGHQFDGVEAGDLLPRS